MNTTPEQTEEEFLAEYDLADYPATGVTADVVKLSVLNGKLSVLLVLRKDHPFRGKWAIPGGFSNPDETLEECALRELAEETGTTTWVEQLKTYGDPGRDPRGHIVSVAYISFVEKAEQPTPGSDAADARWWAVDDLALTETSGKDKVELAFDHATIITDAIERARAKLEYTTLAARLLPQPFTIAELRRVYETVWGVELNQGNFWSKVRKVEGFVVSTGEKASPKGKGAPGDLYKRGDRTEDLFPPIRRGM